MSSEKNGSPVRNYNTISPSAKSLLLFKGNTDIPFARAAAELISLPEKYQPDFDKKDLVFWARTLHFEVRYRSINQLLAPLKSKNILELSSGFSFRGLAAVQDNDIHYIDTDLPELIETKSHLIEALQNKHNPVKGKLELLPLNALDRPGFMEIINRFDAGAITIVNEGLLMYLGIEEKKKLCNIIRDVLKARGGYWITADIYVKLKDAAPKFQLNDQLEHFLKEHNVEENKFDSFEAAEAFFRNEGFILDKEAEPEYANAGSLKYLLGSATEEQINTLSKSGKIQATWRLKLAE